MPNQARSGIRGDPWHACQRCGRYFRVSQLVWQEGLLLCAQRCLDTQTVQQRDIQLARVMDEIGLYPDAQIDPKLTNPDPGRTDG
jgi:hypothetical protein